MMGRGGGLLNPNWKNLLETIMIRRDRGKKNNPICFQKEISKIANPQPSREILEEYVLWKHSGQVNTSEVLQLVEYFGDVFADILEPGF